LTQMKNLRDWPRVYEHVDADGGGCELSNGSARPGSAEGSR